VPEMWRNGFKGGKIVDFGKCPYCKKKLKYISILRKIIDATLISISDEAIEKLHKTSVLEIKCPHCWKIIKYKDMSNEDKDFISRYVTDSELYLLMKEDK
jgi:hypothetical protein